MFPDNFFTDFLLNVQAVKTEAAREVGNKLMLGVLKLSSRGCEKITTASLMALTGVSKPQFYYFTNGMSGLWSNILKAALFNHDTLTAEQRVTIVEAARYLNISRGLPFTSAASLLVDKEFPMRRKKWGQGYVVPHQGRFMYCEQGKEGMKEWSANSEDMLCDDWEIALPYKTHPLMEH
ncbi:hypothetical protein [Citrobacter werkmanii]|uniref:hypothetical protein n=1 Tax=Citrobacter werkmanii TaxID=67827 RepID=UPI0037C55B32